MTPVKNRALRVASDTTWERAKDQARTRLGMAPPVEKKTSAARHKQSLLDRAAYGPPPPLVDKGWLFTPHPYPDFKRVLLDADACERMLAVMVKNRKPRPLRIAKYARQMLQGRFVFTDAGLSMDADGNLQNGGNRAAALVIANEHSAEPIYLDVPMFVGMPVRNFMYLDQGAPRTGGDTLFIDDEKNASQLTTAVRMVMQTLQWKGQTHLKWRSFLVANDELEEAKNEYGDPLRAGIPLGFRVRSYVKGMSVGAVAASYYLIRQTSPEKVVNAWFDGLTYGADHKLPNGGYNPVAVLRNKLLSRVERGEPKFDAFLQEALILKAWGLTAEGISSARIEFPVGIEEFPWNPPTWQGASDESVIRHLKAV